MELNCSEPFKKHTRGQSMWREPHGRNQAKTKLLEQHFSSLGLAVWFVREVKQAWGITCFIYPHPFPCFLCLFGLGCSEMNGFCDKLWTLCSATESSPPSDHSIFEKWKGGTRRKYIRQKLQMRCKHPAMKRESIKKSLMLIINQEPEIVLS